MYERFFGLVDAPFRLTPDPRYLFLSRKHAEVLAHLRLGLKESSGFVCITGDVGTGKTTLLRAFLADLGPEVATAYIFNPLGSALELLQRISRELGLPADSQSQTELVDALNAHLLAQRKAGRVSVVVVDEAQAFSVDVLEQLRLLSNLETTTEKLLRVVLVGQPQLRALLLDPALIQLNQRITLRWHMGPLAYHETAAYVRHRLGVGSNGKVTRLFTPPAVRLLYRLSGGVPRLINMIAHRALLVAFVARRRRVTMRSVLRAYREIGAVPLPARPASRRAAWAAAAAAVCVGLITLGAPRLGWLPDIPRPWSGEHAGADPTRMDAGLAGISHADATLDRAVAAAPQETAPGAPPAFSTAELEQRLASLDPQASARSAVETILEAWHARPLAADETRVPDDLERIAWRRGLEDMPLTGNRSMLRLLDLPVILVLRVPGANEPRCAALTGMDDTRVVLTVDATPITLDAASLDRFWFGQARILWRDFEALGPTIGREARGARVTRLQALLRRAGAQTLAATGEYDGATATEVLGFQRSRLLAVDGLVGPLTRIVLYAAAGGYARPTLAAPTGATS